MCERFKEEIHLFCLYHVAIGVCYSAGL